MMKKNLVMTLLMLLVVQGAFAQALRVVTGKVVDANDGALIGATVSVPGRSLGTVTGLDGREQKHVERGGCRGLRCAAAKGRHGCCDFR